MSLRYAPQVYGWCLLLIWTAAAPQSCPTTMLPPHQGLTYCESLSTGNKGPWFDDLQQAAQYTYEGARNAWTAGGSTVCSLTPTGSDPESGQISWTAEISEDSSCSFPNSYDEANYVCETPICPSGYELKNGTYGGVPGTNYCQKKDASIAVCPDERNDDRNRGFCPGGAAASMTGNPCNAATGNKFQRDVDYAGPDGLQFARYYNSSTTTPLATLGKQWRHEYDRRLVFPTGSTSAYLSGWMRITAQRHDGSVVWFTYDGLTASPVFPDTKEILRRTSPNGWELVTADGAIESYVLNANAAGSGSYGRLIGIKYRTGTALSIQYASAERISKVSDAFGRSLTFAYASNKLSTITDPAGKKLTYQYNTAGYLTAVLYQDNTPTVLTDNPRRDYKYDDTGNPGVLTSIIDEQTQTYAHWTYDASRRATLSEHAGGAERVTLTYNANGTTDVTDAANSTSTHSFGVIQSIPRTLERVVGGASTHLSYSDAGLPTSTTDQNGVETTYDYDALGRETSRTEAAGTLASRTITTQWHSSFRLPALISIGSLNTAFTYDTAGRVLTRTLTDTGTAESRAWTYAYDGYGRVVSMDGPRTDTVDTTLYSYYTCTTGVQCGRLHTVTNALNQVTTFNTYNAYGQPLTITDPNNVVTTLTYDLRLRLISRKIGVEQTTFEYWPTGLLKKVTLPDGRFLLHTYDAAHRLTDVTDATGNHVHYTLDPMGNHTKEESFDPSSVLTQTRSRVFNTLNQLYQEIGAAGTPAVTTTFGYDDNGNRTSINAPLSRTSNQTYDPLNRLTQLTDAASGVASYDFNDLDQLISVTDPHGQVTSYTYNALGDVTSQVSPDTGTTGSTYDSAGNVKTRTDARGKTGTFSYDTLGRLSQLSYPDQTISYTYDQGTNGKGRMTGMSDGSGTTGWTYNTQGRVTSRQQATGSITKSVGFTYYGNGQLQTLTLPSGNTISYSYTNGRLTSLTLNGTTTVLSNILYQPFGVTFGWTWGNGTFAAREYNPDGNATEIDSAGLRTYAYDDAGRLASIADATDPSLSQTYAYDLSDRLTSASGTGLNQSWTYDANGNRLTQSGGSVSTYTIGTSNNRIASIGGALARTYAYDAVGNTIAFAALSFTYDDSGRLESATNGSVSATYKLNAMGQRVRKTIAGVSTYFIYDQAGHLLGEYDNSGALIEETIWLADIPVAVLKSSGVYYVHTDHLSVPRKVTRPSDNAIVWRWDSDPFGTTPANENPSGIGTFTYNLRLPGQYFDSETDIHYNYSRSYDPSTGRYLESDPSGLGGGLNTYAYVRSAPNMIIDPSGLSFSDYNACIAREARFGGAASCLDQLFATAQSDARREYERRCEIVGEVITCTSRCAFDNFIGEDDISIAINAHKKMAMMVLEKIAKETASKAAKAFIPLLGIADTFRDSLGTIICSTDCVKN